ncbi:MAG: glycerol-3-phosphate responsive antiterminator [Microterricola sp.]
MPELPRSLDEKLYRHPVMASLYGTDALAEFLAGPCPVGIVANVALPDMETVVTRAAAAGKFVFVNIDNCDGLAQDRGGVEYLRKIGTPGLITTRTALIQRANALGMVTMQKVFVTDRSTLPRSVNAVQQSKPHLMQLMPWPVISSIASGELAKLSPYVAAGFVTSTDDVVAAIKGGAKAVSTSDVALWNTTRR